MPLLLTILHVLTRYTLEPDAQLVPKVTLSHPSRTSQAERGWWGRGVLDLWASVNVHYPGRQKSNLLVCLLVYPTLVSRAGFVWLLWQKIVNMLLPPKKNLK